MNLFLFFGGAFVLAVAVAALLCRFGGSRSGPLSEAEQRRKDDTAQHSAESDRRVTRWFAASGFCASAIGVVYCRYSLDPLLKEWVLYPAGGLAVWFLCLWAKTRDDGVHPQLRKISAPPPEPPTAGGPPPPARGPRQT